MSSKADGNKVVLTKTERLRFATALYKARKANPTELWRDSFAKALMAMPPARRTHQGKTHPSEVTWLPALLTQLAEADGKGKKVAKPAVKVQPPVKYNRVSMTEEDKLAFAKVVYKLRQIDPPAPWSHCIVEARKAIPAERAPGININHPNHLPWLKLMLEQFDENPVLLREKEERPLRDMRQTLPVVAAEPEQVEPAVAEKHERKTKVFLRALEQMAFAEAVYKAKKDYPRWGWREVFAEANKVLAADRQVASVFPPQWLKELLLEIETRPDPVVAPAPVVVKVEEVAPKEDEAKTEVAPVALAGIALPPTLDLYDLIINAIVSAVKQSVVQIVQSPRLQDSIREAIHPTPEAVGEKVVDRRKKVAVVGLLAVQANDIKVEFGRSLDLRFFESTVTSDQIEEGIKHVDFAVLMTRFTSHKTQDKMRGHSGFMFCNGNSSSLKALLREKVMALQ